MLPDTAKLRAGLSAAALLLTTACSVLPPQEHPPSDEREVVVHYELSDRGPATIEVPASGRDLTVLWMDAGGDATVYEWVRRDEATNSFVTIEGETQPEGANGPEDDHKSCSSPHRSKDIAQSTPAASARTAQFRELLIHSIP